MAHYLVCIAGFPDEVVNEINSRSPAKFTSEQSNSPIVFPLRTPYIYDRFLADRYLRELAARLGRYKHGEYTSIILILADHRADQTTRFAEHFFPFALVSKLDFVHLNAVEKYKRRSALLEYVDSIEKQAESAQGTVRILWDRFGGNCFTPLLLPTGNFKSTILEPRLKGLFFEIAQAQDPVALMERATEDIHAHHPPRAVSGKGRFKTRRCYEDGRQLLFKSPGTDRHSMAREANYNSGHKASCFLGSRVRLGAHFDPLFHFDCSYKSGNVDREYPNCHLVLTKPEHIEWVNIAPNDFVR